MQALHEVEVLTTDYVGEDALLTGAHEGGRRPPALGPMNVHTVVMGRLHVRTGNVGEYREASLSFSSVFTRNC